MDVSTAVLLGDVRDEAVVSTELPPQPARRTGVVHRTATKGDVVERMASDNTTPSPVQWCVDARPLPRRDVQRGGAGSAGAAPQRRRRPGFRAARPARGDVCRPLRALQPELQEPAPPAAR